MGGNFIYELEAFVSFMSLFSLRREGVKDKYWSYWERDDLLFTTPLKLVIPLYLSECLVLQCSVCFGSHLDLQYLRVDLSVLPACIYIHPVHAVPTEVRREHQILFELELQTVV